MGDIRLVCVCTYDMMLQPLGRHGAQCSPVAAGLAPATISVLKKCAFGCAVSFAFATGTAFTGFTSLLGT